MAPIAACVTTSGSVIHDADVVVARAIRMVKIGEVTSVDGSVIKLEVQTICLHGDTPGAAALARQVRQGLEGAGITIGAFGRT